MNPTPEKNTQLSLPLSKPAESSSHDHEPAYPYGVERCRFCAERHAWEPMVKGSPSGNLVLNCPTYGMVAVLGAASGEPGWSQESMEKEIGIINLTQNRYHHVINLPQRQLGQWQQDGRWDFLAPPAETARDIAARLDKELMLREVTQEIEDPPILAVAVTLQDLKSLLDEILDESGERRND